LGAGGTRLPARFRGVGFFNAVLACAADGTFFDAVRVRTTEAAFFGGFVSSVGFGIAVPSLADG
jgi:hypothetical protein